MCFEHLYSLCFLGSFNNVAFRHSQQQTESSAIIEAQLFSVYCKMLMGFTGKPKYNLTLPSIHMCVASWPGGPSDKLVVVYISLLSCKTHSYPHTHIHSHNKVTYHSCHACPRHRQTFPAFHLLLVSGFMFKVHVCLLCLVYGWKWRSVSDRLVYVSITPLFQIKLMMSPPALHHLHLQQVGNHDDPSSNHCLHFFTNVVAIKMAGELLKFKMQILQENLRIKPAKYWTKN